jgi:outer membrane protein OmpA-like peptidoglycan-associated protein
MATYRTAVFRWARNRARPLGVSAVLSWWLAAAPGAGAQQNRYLFELGAGGGISSFDRATDLGSAPSGVVRLGIRLPLNFSIEGDAAFSSARARTTDVSVKVQTFAGSALYNIPVGEASGAYLKAGVGTTRYGSGCPEVSTPGSAICGSSGALLLGGGFRVGITPRIMIRGEALYNRNRSDSVHLSNYGASLGVGVLLAGRALPDGDRDGVPNNRDECTTTPTGAQVDGRGCPLDSDADGVANGLDRCPGTPAGAVVDATGCPKDSDGDNILDGLDRCPDTRPGVLVDRQGCPRDTDGDGIADGLDRCSATPKGAIVDALGCPGDEDQDGVLDGIDQCPRTAAGASIDAVGCSAEQRQVRRPTPAPAPAPTPTPAPAPPPKPGPSATIPDAATILAGVTFIDGTARLRQDAFGVLDSVAAILLADTTVYVEVGAHTDNTAAAAESQRLTARQAVAVRLYFIEKGVRLQRIAAKGYGSSAPIDRNTTQQGRARNRRVEIRRIPAAP